MESIERQLRSCRRQLRQSQKLATTLMTKTSLKLEEISKLESITVEFKEELDQYREVISEAVELYSDEEEKESLTREESELCDWYHSANAKYRAQKQEKKNEQNRNSLVPQAVNENNAGNHEGVTPKLKKIGVPTFDGDVLAFQNFKNLFENLVHSREELSNVQKLFYLKEALIGKAKDFIRDFPLAEDAYPEAWDYLLNRFNNKRLVIRTLFRRMVELETIKNPNQIGTHIDQIDVIMRGLRANGLEIDQTFSKFVCYYVASKLDNRTSMDWENSLTNVQEFPSYKELCSFLRIRAFAVEDRAEQRAPSPISTPLKGRGSEKTKSVFIAEKGSCYMCKKNHPIYLCEQFKAEGPKERYEIIKNKNLCLVCFGTGHTSSNCDRRRFKCGRCSGNHNYLLHFNATKVEPNQKNENPAKQIQEKIEKVSYSCSNLPTKKSEKLVLLPTAIVRFYCDGKTGKARVLLDSCSQTTLISDTFVKKHKLKVAAAPSLSTIKGIGGSTIVSSTTVSLTLMSKNGHFKINADCDIVSADKMHYSGDITFPQRIVKQLKQLDLADPSYISSESKNMKIDILLGAEHFGRILLNKSKSINELDVRLTQFGWIVSGVVLIPHNKEKFCGFTSQNIDETLQKFWKIEEMPTIKTSNSEEEENCVKFFESNLSIAKDGKFVVRLPLKIDPTNISENRYRALSALTRIENRLESRLKPFYKDFMKEYLLLGHMSLVGKKQEAKLLPYQAVLRPGSTSTPLRVVFNASAREKEKLSLNEALMKGPTIQRDLFDILISMRTFRFVFTCDIEKMYRMIWVHPEDRYLQSILWRESSSETAKEYQLNTITYGTTPASFIATKCLEVIARGLEERQPKVADLILNNFYMDDFVGGAETLEETLEIYRSLQYNLKKFGFNLRKYSSNSKEFMKEVPQELHEKKTSTEIKNELSNISILGLKWCADKDSYQIKVNIEPFNKGDTITRRIILSYISRTFDPLGFCAPVTVRSKILLQKVWAEGKTWDAPVSAELELLFCNYLSEIKGLVDIEIPRMVIVSAETQIVSFCDASNKLYAAAVYIRSKDSEGNVKCQLMCSKTRVAPLKELTIPRLELLAAVLMSELTSRVMRNLNVSLENTFAFSDSVVVLCWLSKPPIEWGTFVANRVKKVIELIPFKHWFYVNTKENPADDASRGVTVDQLRNSSRWFYGPRFVKHPSFPSFFKIPNLETEMSLERRKEKVVLNITIEKDFVENFSSYYKLLRVVAYIRRWKNKEKGPITNRELAQSFNCVIQFLQNKFYSKEIVALKQRATIKTSTIRSLSPMLGEDNLLRVTGRLNNSSLARENKTPIIIPPKSKFARLFVLYVHERYFHAGFNFILAYFNGKYWFVGGIARLIKTVTRNCVNCKRAKGIVAKQPMGQLPPARVNASRPFSNVGIDFAGPFTCRCVAHRTTKLYKIYVAVFVCFAVRAVHLEVVSDLSTDGFVLAFKRFAARRGVPTTVWTDNGTNFVGARNLFRANHSKLVEFATSEGFCWNFIPPASPQFGGIWEAAVKSMKKHLMMATKDSVLNFEEYATLIARIEAILNCRPLCYKRNLSQECEVITPAHFLIGQSLTSLPVIDQEEMTLSRRLELIRSHLRGIWKIWHRDYLNQLQMQSRKAAREPNIEVNDIVLLRDQRCRPFSWPLARIVRTFPASDGVVRVVELKTSKGVFRRSIGSIVRLISDSEA